jgi:PAS domain S-box-containing protein
MTSDEERADLRQQAEDRLQKQSPGRDAAAPETAQDLLHELQVHQIELEMQNEELREAQAKLEASRARYFDLYDMAPVGYFTLSQRGLILEANLAAATLLGVARASLVKQPITHFFFPEDQDIYYLHHKRLAETGVRQVFEVRVVRPGGAPIWVRLEAISAQLDEAGAPVCRIMMSDITAQKEAERERERLLVELGAERERGRLLEALRIQRDLGVALGTAGNLTDTFDRVLQAALRVEGIDCGGVYLVDSLTGELRLAAHTGVSAQFAEHTAHYAAGSSQARLALKGEPIYGQYAGVAPHVDEVRRREGLRAFAILPAKHEEQVIASLYLASHTRDEFSPGTRDTLEAIATRVGGAIARIRAESQREAALSQREAALEALRESQSVLTMAESVAQIGSWKWDLATRKVAWSDEMFHLFGIDRAEFDGDVERVVSMRVHPDDLPAVQQANAGVLQAGQPTPMQYRICLPDGTERVVWAEGRLACDEAGQAVALTGYVQDITERVRIEAALNAALADKEMLMREIYHRVKNNIQTLIYLLEWQAEYVSDPDIRMMIDEIKERARTMALVHEKLYQTRNLTQIDFGNYLHDLVSNLSRAFRTDQPIAWRVDAEDVMLGVDQAIPCGLIVNELLTNTLKYAFPDRRPIAARGESECTVSVEFRAEGDQLVLRVSDNGIGLPPGVEWTTTHSLGMQLINILARHQLGGQIEVDSRAGTAFKITFPQGKRSVVPAATP